MKIIYGVLEKDEIIEEKEEEIIESDGSEQGID